MNNTTHVMSPEYRASVLDRLSKEWDELSDKMEDLKFQGVTKAMIAEIVGCSKRTMTRSFNFKTNKEFMSHFAVPTVINIIHEDIEALPNKKKRKRRKNQVKKSEIRVVRGS